MPTINCGNNKAKGGRPKGRDVRKRVGTPKEIVKKFNIISISFQITDEYNYYFLFKNDILIIINVLLF